MQPQAAAMQALLKEPTLQVMPGCGDAIGARLIQEAGFKTASPPVPSISAMRLAMPDMDLLTFPEMARHGGQASSPPRRTCCGWPMATPVTATRSGVQKTIRGYARAGAAAVLIEDKIWPRPLGHQGAKLVIERDGGAVALPRGGRGVPRGGHSAAGAHRRARLARLRRGGVSG